MFHGMRHHHHHDHHRHHGGPRGGGWGRGGFAFGWAGEGPERSGGRGRRMFDGDELRLVLLHLIADSPRHGYELIKAIEELTGGSYAPSPGVVYPSLTMLGELNHIEEQASEGARKRFAATADGRAHLAAHAEQVAALIARLTGLGAESDRVSGQHLPIRRAMGNLRQAVRDRIVRGDLADDRLHDIAALIDEATQKIERLK